MGDTEKRNTDMMQHRIHSSFAISSCSIPKQTLSMNHQLDVPQLNPQFTPSHHLPQLSQSFNGSGENGGRIRVPPSHPSQIPPISPYSHIPITRQPSSQNFTSAPTHSRSLSQPSSFFSFDSLPPLSPSPYHDSPSASISDHDLSMEDSETRGVNPSFPALHFSRANGNSSRISENLPSRKRSHRRSNSDIPYGFNPLIQNSPFPPKGLERSVSGGESSQWPKIAQLMKKEPNWERSDDSNREGEVVDDLFSAYMNLDNIDVLNSSGAEEINKSNENREDLDSSRVSMTKTNGCNSSDTEAESSVNESQNSYQIIERTYSFGEKTGSVKRSAGGDARHYRSISMDSCFMGKLNFGDESLNLPPSPGGYSVQLSPSNSAEGNSLSLEFGSSEFTTLEMKKIMGNEKLAEIALTDPKRVKRILANRQSAARSKERKMRYIAELEHKVQTLQTEATTLSAQLTLLQRDSMGLTNQNNELKFRLQAMDQQTQLRDALNEALTAEVQRLKLEMGARESDHSKSLSVSPEMFQQQLSIHQSQQNQLQQKDQRQIKNEEAKPNSN